MRVLAPVIVAGLLRERSRARRDRRRRGRRDRVRRRRRVHGDARAVVRRRGARRHRHDRRLGARSWSASARCGASSPSPSRPPAAMELIGIQRPRGRDLATGIVLGAGLGLAALFLYLDTTAHNTTGATVTILFGSLFAVASSTIPLVVAARRGRARRSSALLYRPLLLSSVSPELAAARGIPVRARRRRLPARARARGRAGGDHDRHDPLDRAAGRPRRHRAAPDPPPGPGDRRGRR